MHKVKLAATLASVAFLLLQSPAANAERDGEYGVFIGAHIFNENNELGVLDDVSSESLEDAFTFGIRAAYAITGMLDLEGELAITPTKGTESSVDVVGFGWRGHAVMHLLDGRFRPFLLAGAGAMTSSSEDERVVGSETDFVWHGGVGLKIDIQDSWGIRLDARVLLPPSSASESVTTDYEGLLGIYKTFGGEPAAKKASADDDGDGISNDDDKCPSDAEDLDMFQDEDGCPEADNDEDGVPDASDDCPDLPEDLDGVEDTDGCAESDETPDGPAVGDIDGDGIEDSKDKCPAEPEDKDGFEDADGCAEKDNDNDGVGDTIDLCPLKPETKNGYQDTDGCPDTVPEKLKSFAGAIKGIQFQTGKAKIRKSSFKVLKRAVATFSEFTDLKIEVQGHTDSEGSEEVNTKLSQDRAQAVLDYLVKEGVAADRLSAKGYGSTRPVGDNATKAGQNENRRVEFQLNK